MSATGLDVFDRTLQTTHIWLDEIMEAIGPDKQRAWHVLGAVLRALRDRLPVPLAAHFGAQMPLLVRGLYYDQWRPSEQSLKMRSAEEFFSLVSQGLHGSKPIDVKDATRAVFHVLDHHLEPNQMKKVREALPADIRAIWPQAGPAKKQSAA